ncbi:ABC-type uncharacterized transport system [uncultured archaeon]|nr:ABC-type uncharacterized transport system [uncultured archaeon]
MHEIEFSILNLRRSEGLERIIPAILAILALNLFSLNFGYMSPYFGHYIGLLSLLSILVFYLSSSMRMIWGKTAALGVFLIFIAFALVLLFSRIEVWLSSVSLFICGLDLILRSKGIIVKELPAIALGSLIYTTLYIYIYYNSFLWSCVQIISISFSRFIGLVGGVPLALGPSVGGLFVLLSFISFSASFLIFSEKKNADVKTFLSLAGSLIISLALYTFLFTTPWMGGESAVHAPYIVFLFFSLIFSFFISKFHLVPVDQGDPLPGPQAWQLIFIIFFSFLLMTTFSYSSHGNSGKVVFFEKDCEMNFDIPQFPKDNEYLRPDRGFSIGAFELYLKTIGYDVIKFNETNIMTLKEVLKDADALVLLNLNKPMNSTDLQSIWDFIERGGSLLVFGEHTSMFVDDNDFQLGKDYLNDILAPTGIRVNSDTAEYPSGCWKYAVSSMPHACTCDIGFEITTSSVGASLGISGDAKPVLLGRYGFSDNPNQSEPGHLGDREYEKGEKLGDILLGASEEYGRGKILVIGDTSYILNPEVTTKYKLLANLIAWLLSEKSEPLALLSSLSFLLPLILVLYILGFNRPKGIATSSIAYASLVIAVSLMVSGSINDSLMDNSYGIEMMDIGWIDHTHLNRFDLGGYTAGSIDGLTTNLIRNGYMPLLFNDEKDFSSIIKGKSFFIIGPSKRYTWDEVRMLKDFVGGGGLLVISAGYDSKEPLDILLSEFGMNILRIPLGSPPWIVETHGQASGVISQENLDKYRHKPKFLDAYPLEASGNYASITSLTHDGIIYNLVISKSFGRGEVILIGDSRFLLNENLEYLTIGPGETKTDYQLQWLGNIELLREIISQFKGGKK